MLCDALIALLFIVFPLRYFFPVDPETDVDTPVINYIVDDPPSCLSNQARPPPLVTRYRPTFSILLALELCSMLLLSVIPILMHSLSLLLLLLPLPAILLLSIGC